MYVESWFLPGGVFVLLGIDAERVAVVVSGSKQDVFDD